MRSQYSAQDLSRFFRVGHVLTRFCHFIKNSSTFFKIEFLITAQQRSWGKVFFLIFGGHKSFLWGHWYPCFGLLVTSPLDFKARVGNLICTKLRHTWYIFPEIHLWCDMCWPLGSQHGSCLLSPHACFSRGRLLDADSNARPPTQKSDMLTIWPQ